jgi:hypothetical protein
MRFAGSRKSRMVRGESLNLFRAGMRFAFFGALRRLRRERRSRPEGRAPQARVKKVTKENTQVQFETAN